MCGTRRRRPRSPETRTCREGSALRARLPPPAADRSGSVSPPYGARAGRCRKAATSEPPGCANRRQPAMDAGRPSDPGAPAGYRSHRCIG